MTGIDLAILALTLATSFAYALILQFWGPAKWLVVNRTWITVVIGVGYSIGFTAAIVSPEDAIKMLIVFGIAAIPIVIRSLANEQKNEREATRRHE